MRVFTESSFPLLWARTQSNLGNAYALLPTGNRGANLGRAISCFEAALRVLTQSDSPMDWASTQENLGSAYTQFPLGNHEDSLRRAIRCYEFALRVWTESGFSCAWARTQYKLGKSYENLASGDREENLRRAVSCYELALRVWTETDFPDLWTRTHYELGNVHRQLLTENRADNLRRAVRCYTAALRMRILSPTAIDWEEVDKRLATCLIQLDERPKRSGSREHVCRGSCGFPGARRLPDAPGTGRSGDTMPKSEKSTMVPPPSPIGPCCHAIMHSLATPDRCDKLENQRRNYRMTTHLPEHLERYVHDQVQAGRFRNEDDVIIDALEIHRQAQQPTTRCSSGWRSGPGLHARRRRADGRDRCRRLPPSSRRDLAGNRPLNKSLLDTDIFSDITKGLSPTVNANATAYRKTFARYTISAVTSMEVVRGYQKKQAFQQQHNFLTAIASEEVIPFDRPDIDKQELRRHD